MFGRFEGSWVHHRSLFYIFLLQFDWFGQGLFVVLLFAKGSSANCRFPIGFLGCFSSFFFSLSEEHFLPVGCFILGRVYVYIFGIIGAMMEHFLILVIDICFLLHFGDLHRLLEFLRLLLILHHQVQYIVSLIGTMVDILLVLIVQMIPSFLLLILQLMFLFLLLIDLVVLFYGVLYLWRLIWSMVNRVLLAASIHLTIFSFRKAHWLTGRFHHFIILIYKIFTVSTLYDRWCLESWMDLLKLPSSYLSDNFTISFCFGFIWLY